LTEAAAAVPWFVTAGTPIVTFVLGFLTSRLTMSRKERKDFEQGNYQNALHLAVLHNDAYEKYTTALTEYIEAGEQTFLLFKNIMTSGDIYFYQAHLMCDAILSDKVDVRVRDNTLLKKIRDVAERTLPSHYKTLQEIAEKKGFQYEGKLRREDHESIYAVVERFSASPSWSQ
jgi:hypothetical protein